MMKPLLLCLAAQPWHVSPQSCSAPVQSYSYVDSGYVVPPVAPPVAPVFPPSERFHQRERFNRPSHRRRRDDSAPEKNEEKKKDDDEAGDGGEEEESAEEAKEKLSEKVKKEKVAKKA